MRTVDAKAKANITEDNELIAYGRRVDSETYSHVASNTSYQIGHSGVPLRVMSAQIGSLAWSSLTSRSPTLAALFTEHAANMGGLCARIRYIAMYSPSLVAVVMSDDRDTFCPLALVRYMVAFHEDSRVRIIGVSNEGDAGTLYDQVPSRWAKILLARSTNEVLRSHGNDKYTAECALSIRSAPLVSARYMVAYHEKDYVHSTSCANLRDAESLYEQISRNLAKVLVRLPANEVVKSYGKAGSVQQCVATITSVPLGVTHFAVVFHESGFIRVLGCADQVDAEAVYKQVSPDWAKVLMELPSNRVLISYGDKECAIQCERMVQSIPLTDTHYTVAFHESGSVRMMHCSSHEDAQAMYTQISCDLAKVLMEVPTYEVLESNGGVGWVKRCKLSVRTASFCTPRSTGLLFKVGSSPS